MKNVQVSDYPSCPICLYPPVAAKMTRCGHVYCWSCILHYLSLSDKTWRKCPICYESIHKQDLKSVVTKHYKTFNVDDVITFKLMKRPKGSLVTYPATAIVKDEEVFNFSESVDVYSKLLIANQAEILSIIERENNELMLQLEENGECPENCFLEEALTLLNQRKETVSENLLSEKVTLAALNNLDINENSDTDTFDSSKVENLDISTNQQSKFHYFYQGNNPK